MSKFVMATVALLLMAFIVSWELFLLVMRDASVSTAGARFHIWLALGAGALACIAGGLMFRFFSRYEKNKWSKVEMTPTGPLLTAVGGIALINTPGLVRFDPERWALANAWLTEGQADDRTPIDGSVPENGDGPSGQRAFARSTHQLMFKKWSQARHD